MQITYSEFFTHVKPSGFVKNGFKILPLAHKRTVSLYCDVLTTHSACTQDCKLCLQEIRRRLNEERGWMKEGVTPVAIYTTILKHAAQTKIEEAHKTAAPERPNPLIEEVDVLDTLMETFND